MAKIKHSFTGAKMDKDLDERLVKQGEYRNAMNIQIRTTDGDSGVGDAGVVQNLEGNSEVGTATGQNLDASFATTDFTCVSSISDEKTDSAFFLFTSGDFSVSDESSTTSITKIDTIIRENVTTNVTTPVFVDKWGFQCPISSIYVVAPTGTISSLTVPSIVSNLRVNMNVEFYQVGNDANVETAKIKSIDSNTIHFWEQVDTTLASWGGFTHARFTHDRVLKLDPNVNITGINIIDDLLFFTDGINEPKKINITRSIRGTTTDGNSHTQLYVTNENYELELAGDLEFGANQIIVSSDVLEEHVTVLRPAPKTPPTIHVDARDFGELQFVTPNKVFADLDVGDVTSIGLDTDGNPQTSPPLSQTTFRPGDEIQVSEENSLDSNLVSFKVTFVNYLDDTGGVSDVPTDEAQIEIVTISDEITSLNLEWLFKIVLPKPKLELKFARFGYRYKYEDGEYSAFSPFSELAFDPGLFDYDSVSGYNLGMVNTIQSLTIKDFIPYYTERALDIVEVEILYKTTNDANVYTVRSIKKEKDPEWELFTPGDATTTDSIETGQLEITSETIHRVVTGNQLLRTFDNVPRLALAQEITGSRILYGNYVQGFDITAPVSLSQIITSTEVGQQPKKSIKTLRDYKVAMVFGDKYGRETTVIESSTVSGDVGAYVAQSDDLYVEKSFCALANKIKVQQSWSNPLNTTDPLIDMDWMSYVKYYVKETSREYYNLVLDRWYYARNQDNIWLSFPSADRNKVDLETYLELKKAHGEDTPVLEEARYKIIDIDNEAPDFIKTEERPMGTTLLGRGAHVSGGSVDDIAGLFTDTTMTPNANAPDLLVDEELGKEITIPSSLYGGDGDVDFLDNYGLTQRGQLKARIVGRTMNLIGSTVPQNEVNSGDFVKVNHFYRTKNNDLKITLEKSFGERANMFQAFTDAGYTVGPSTATSANDLQYFVEFMEEVVENKPEFDGRFFVLIEKDFAIEKHVEKFLGSSSNFIPTAFFKIGYVDSQQYNPALNGKYSEDCASEPGGCGSLFGTSTAMGSGLGYGVDDTAPHKWWGFGAFGPTNGDSPHVNLFAMGCGQDSDPGDLSARGHHNGQNAFAMKTLTKNYWVKHKEYHEDNEVNDLGLNIGEDSVGTGFHRVFLDGARAIKYNLREFNSNNEGSEALGEAIDADPIDLGLSGVPFSSKVRNDDDIVDGGVSWYNYKPTALDPGGADIGFGRMVISKVVNCNKINFGDSGMDIYNFFSATPYFRFVQDRSNPADPDNFPNGQPYIYKVIQVDVNDPSIIMSQDFTDKVRNFGANPSDDIDTNEINSDQAFGASQDPPRFSGVFGGENAEIWNTIQWRADMNSEFGAGTVEDLGGNLSSFRLRVRDNLNPNSDGGGFFSSQSPSARHKSHRTCNDCGNGEDPYCCRQSIRFEFRKVDPDTGELTNDGLLPGEFDPRGLAKHDGTVGNIEIEILRKSTSATSVIVPEDDRAVWETEPKEDADLDIYYEATHALPMKLNKDNTLAFAPLKSKVGCLSSTGELLNIPDDIMVAGVQYVDDGAGGDKSIIRLTTTGGSPYTDTNFATGNYLTFTHKGGLKTRTKITGYYSFNAITTAMTPSDTQTSYYELDSEVYQEPVELGWHNCYSFGNGVESDRIRDDFNAPQIDNGVRVSTTIDDYGKENKTSGLIFSGLYNSISGVNDLNEFNMGEKIIKNLNPAYGSIQALKTRDTNVVVFCEDRILKVQANKEAVFLADNRPDLVATDRVLGTVSTFVGDYGISQNPESIAQDTYRLYFTDTQRGAVLRLSMDGLTPISSVGMKTWFRENLRNKTKLLGTFDNVNGEYNLTISPPPVVENVTSPTISFNEASKGWVSFKSFDPDEGTSVSGRYLTVKDSGIYKHYNNEFRNVFYNNDTDITELPVEAQSTLTVMFNDVPSQVKSFKAMNYEGSQARIRINTDVGDSSYQSQYYNLENKDGWWVDDLHTDLQEGAIKEFIDKENKWFNKIAGIHTTLDNLDTSEFTVQGIGIPTSVVSPTPPALAEVEFRIKNKTDND